MIVRKFSKDDLLKINVQDIQKDELNFSAVFPETSFVLEADGEILGIFGVVDLYKGRGAVFAFVSRDAGKHMTAVVRFLHRVIESGMSKSGYERLETSVVEGFPAGDRLVRMLGFDYDGLMRKYFKGKNYNLFARVK